MPEVRSAPSLLLTSRDGRVVRRQALARRPTPRSRLCVGDEVARGVGQRESIAFSAHERHTRDLPTALGSHLRTGLDRCDLCSPPTHGDVSDRAEYLHKQSVVDVWRSPPSPRERTAQ